MFKNLNKMENRGKSRFFLIPLFFLFLFIDNSVFSQFNFIYNDSIPVIKGSDTIPLAWAGGMNHPQFSTIDLDFDGTDELVAFEPENGHVNVYKRELVSGNVVYKYWYEGSKLFPSDLRFKMKLVDYDGDGRKDLFAYTPGGIKVYRNIGSASNGTQWKLMADPLTSFNGTLTTNLYSSSTEISAYYDVDGDGDIDVLTFAPAVKRVIWHRNLSMETYGHADSLIFKLEQECWGEFVESGGGNTIILNSTIPPCGTSPLPTGPDYTDRHQGGGSILALDINNDGLTDLIIGDNEYNNLTLVINGGTIPDENALMTSYEPDFPGYDVSVDIPNFVTGYYEDYDLDGVKDLIASTTELTLKTSENTRGVWVYKNNGTDTQPIFELKQKGFLQDDMIENGTSSIPILVDVDNDGLIDLLIANDFNFVDDGSTYSPNASRINYYRNIGSAENPVFKLTTKDWRNFSISGFAARVSPSFGDLDGDGDKDMIVGLKTGKLYYYENSGGSGPMNFNVTHYQLKDNNGSFITVSSYATPELFDLDNDGKLDLIIGQGNGPILYYRNVGTSSNYSFELVNNDLGGVVAASQEAVVPRFTRNNDTTYLIVGNKEGRLSFYDDIDDNLNQGDDFNVVSSKFLAINTKGFSAPIMGQIRNDNSFDLFVGNTLGGLWSFRPGDTTYLGLTTQYDALLDDSRLIIYPNPNKGDFTLKISDLNGQKYDYRILDPLGRTLISKKQEYKSEVNIHLEASESGIYFVELITSQSKQRFVKKLIVE